MEPLLESGAVRETVTTIQWQERSSPLMTRMVVGLTVFFFLASCAQLVFLQLHVASEHDLDVSQVVSLLSPRADAAAAQSLELSKLRVIVTLEADAQRRQYHQASILLMARVWTNYLGFVTGMILALVGAVFILGKLQGPASELKATSRVTDFAWRSASPGLTLAVLGVILMVTTIVVHHRIDTSDNGNYLRALQQLTPTASSSPPPLSPLPTPRVIDSTGGKR
jgi:hypothetical protein